LEVRQGELASEARKLRAASCREVAEALAVVVANAPRGADEPAAPPAEEAAAPLTPGSPPPLAAEPARPAPIRKPAPETRLRTIGLWGNEQVPVTAGSLQVNRALALTLTGGVTVGAIPGVVLPRYDFALSRANFITTPGQGSFLVGNVFGVSWTYFGPATRKSEGYSTDIHGLKAGVSSCTPLTYDTTGFVALFCGAFTVGVLSQETKEEASSYHQEKVVGLGAASLLFDTRYNFSQYVHAAAIVGGDVWVSKLSAERADGSELFHSRLFNASVQLGLGAHF